MCVNNNDKVHSSESKGGYGKPRGSLLLGRGGISQLPMGVAVLGFTGVPHGLMESSSLSQELCGQRVYLLHSHENVLKQSINDVDCYYIAITSSSSTHSFNIQVP